MGNALLIPHMFAPVKGRRLSEEIASQIREAVLNGQLRAGDRLPPERELARIFGASALVVRDALHTLESDGLLRIRLGAGGGAVVDGASHRSVTRSLSTWLRLGKATLDQLTEARLLLEPEIARLAALRATGGDLEVLDAALAKRGVAVATGGHPRLLDIQFHRAVAEAAKNPVHLVVIHALMDLEAEAVVPALALTADDNREVLRAHEGILAAIRGRDAARAQALMAEHVLDVQQRLKQLEHASRLHLVD